ncbi:hypothetical protein SPRG_17587, partial [Saprolegnia parasitica CBS 223.65]
MSLTGHVIAITGKLSLGTRADVQSLVEANGGVFATAVTKEVTHLVTNDPTAKSTKLETARKRGITVVGEDFLPTAKRHKATAVAYHAACLANMVFYFHGPPGAVTKDDCVRFLLEHGGAHVAQHDATVTHIVSSKPPISDLATGDATTVTYDFFSTLMAAQYEALFGDDAPSETPTPKRVLAEGDAVEIQGGHGTYEVRLRNGVYYCTCMAWKMQHQAGAIRTCKHLREVLGDAFEAWRTQGCLPTTGSKSKSNSSPIKKGPAPKVLLAQKYEDGNDITGWFMSEKFDGVRGYWNGSTFLSRLGNPFPAPAYFTQHLPKDQHLDGELFLGRKQFEATISIVKNGHPDNAKNWASLTFMVFDIPSLKDQPFEARYEYLRTHLAKTPYVTVVDHVACASVAAMTTELARVEALGAEGLMLRQPGSKYVGARSTSLLKVKSFSDDEAKIVGYEPGQGKHKGRTGSLKCVSRSGKSFKVGSGLNDKLREHPPAIGTIITYRFQELTAAGIPRFPTYVGIAIDKEWTD